MLVVCYKNHKKYVNKEGGLNVGCRSSVLHLTVLVITTTTFVLCKDKFVWNLLQCNANEKNQNVLSNS